MTTNDSQPTTNGSQDVAELHNQATIDFNQAIVTLDKSIGRLRSIDRLAAELEQCTKERDKLRADIAGLLAELIEERQQRIEAKSVVQEVARWLHKISLWECDGWPDESRVGLEARYYKKQTLSCHIGSVRLGDLRKLKERMKDGEEDQ